MHHMKSAPPLEPLATLVARLERAGIVTALGGSGLLAALGLTDHVRDWDLTTDTPLDVVTRALGETPFEHKGSDALHADQKLMLEGGTIEIILGFAFHTDGGVVHIPTVVTSRWQGIPLGSPEGWAVAYALLGRAAKSEALLAHLASEGADRRVVERLLGQALPSAIAARLGALTHFK
jgi:hypothetical protein